GPLAEYPLDVLRALFDTNVIGAVAMAQRVFPHMADRKSGRIVNIGSIVGVVPTPYAAPYCASKAALHTLTKVMRMEVRPFGIDVIEVQPGAVRSNIGAVAARGLDRYAAPTSRYRFAHARLVRRAGASQRRPTEAEEFARRLVRAVTRTRPPRRVRIGRLSFSVPLLAALLPARVSDALLSHWAGLRERLPASPDEP